MVNGAYIYNVLCFMIFCRIVLLPPRCNFWFRATPRRRDDGYFRCAIAPPRETNANRKNEAPYHNLNFPQILRISAGKPAGKKSAKFL